MKKFLEVFIQDIIEAVVREHPPTYPYRNCEWGDIPPLLITNNNIMTILEIKQKLGLSVIHFNNISDDKQWLSVFNNNDRTHTVIHKDVLAVAKESTKLGLKSEDRISQSGKSYKLNIIVEYKEDAPVLATL